MLQQMGASVDCTVPYFGFKAKQWTRGPPFNPHCTVPYFGFKAKPPPLTSLHMENCTVPYFGFKAKLNLNRPQI